MQLKITINSYDKLIEICQYLLFNHNNAKTAKNHLDKRKLSIETIKKFNFGFFPLQSELNILFSFIDKDILIQNNILYEKYIGQDYKILSATLENHNLILPYKDTYGNAIALVGRSLLSDKDRCDSNISKYKNTSFQKKKYLFGLNEAKRSIIVHNCVYIVEGQFDVIQAHNHGLENVVGLGSSNMSIEQLILLLRYTNKIYLLLDNDEAGEIGRNRIFEKFGKYARFTNLKIPKGFKDLDEFLSECGSNKKQLCDILS